MSWFESFGVTVWLAITAGAAFVAHAMRAVLATSDREAARTLRPVVRAAVLVIAIWIVLASYFCWTSRLGFPPGQTVFLPWDALRYAYVPVVVYAPAAAYWIARRRSPAFDHLCRRISLPRVIGSQLYRVVGVYFAILALRGEFPRAIGIPVGASAFLVGLAALPVAAVCERPSHRRLVSTWNAVGLAYFHYATWTVIAAVAGLVAFEPAPTAVFSYPLSYIVVFGLPFSMVLHLIVHSRLAAPPA